MHITGVAGSQFGYSIDCAGDVNGDQIDDIIISAPYAQYSSRIESGSIYIIYGTAIAAAAALFENLDVTGFTPGESGFIIGGPDSYSHAGVAVAAAGDVNGDGYADVVIGCNECSSNYGAAFVVYGDARDILMLI